MVNAAERPLIYAGGGVIAAGASGEMLSIARKAGMPVATTMMGIGSVDADDPQSIPFIEPKGNV